jgi:hypothetical protein
MNKINLTVLIITCFAVIISLWDILSGGDGYLLGMIGLPLLALSAIISVVSLILTRLKKK